MSDARDRATHAPSGPVQPLPGTPRADTFADEGFWTGYYDFLFPERRFEQAARLVDDSALLALPPGSRVLDLCCGPGVFTAPLALRGHRVTGVDRSPAMLARAAELCTRTGARARLVEADVLRFAEPRSYDMVLNMFTSFGYFPDPADNAAVLRTMYDALVLGGTLLLDVAGKELLAQRVRPPKVLRRGPDLLVQEDTVLDDWARLRSDWTLVRGDRVQRAALVWFVYSAVELRGMAEAAGFAEVELFGGFDSRPYDADADRLVLRARRPAVGGA